MNNENQSGGTAHQTDDEVQGRWWQLEVGLTAYLGQMTDPDEGDHLILELPSGDEESGCAPYAQLAGFGEGQMLRAELSGNAYLAPEHRLGTDACRVLVEAGWAGNDEAEPNWFVMRPIEEAAEVAAQVVRALREQFGVTHPQLLSHQAWGPAASYADVLGLCATDDVPVDEPKPPLATDAMQAVRPRDPDELMGLIRAVLRDKLDEEPTVDDDGDAVITHLGQPVFVRARPDQPAVEIVARVAHGAYSRRAAAVEIAILNRNSAWVRWELHGRDVIQTVWVPAMPFVPQHLDDLLDLFLSAMTEHRDDLALRIRAKVA